MFFELIAAIVAGGFTAGIVMILNRLTGRRLPRWLMPVAAGLAMIAYTITMEYTWFSRTSTTLPAGLEVTDKHDARNFWRPWTYFAPVTDRFVAVDRESVRINEAVPHQRIADLLFFGRWQKPEVAPMVIDCDERRGAPLLDSVTFDASGAVQNAPWAPIPEDDTAFEAVCEEIRS